MKCPSNGSFLVVFLKRFCSLIFREQGREGEREGEKHHMWLFLKGPPLGTWLICSCIFKEYPKIWGKVFDII